MNSYFIRRLDFSDVMLYAITMPQQDPITMLEKADQMLTGGVDAIQFRAKGWMDKDALRWGKELKSRCDAHQALFIVNDRPDLALALDAHGVHLGHNDLPPEFARELMGHRKLVGRSTHTLPEALEAQRKGADYVSCGPIWATPTKPDYNPVGLNLIDFYRATLKIPFVVIGGVDMDNIDDVIGRGSKTVAMVRALFEAEDPKEVARKMKEKISFNWEEKKLTDAMEMT
jgi:thiamine-phosphate pyrophosphorylase